jgi:cell division protein FtsA
VRTTHHVFEPLAAAEGVLTFEEKEFGCVSISMGAFLTHVVVYIGGCPVFSKEYSLGSHYITKDLSIGLRTTQTEAERIKREFGKAIDLCGKDGVEKVDVLAVDMGGMRQINKKEIYQIIEARVREIFHMVYIDLKKSKLLAKTSKGIVLSGGGSLLSGISLASEKTFGLHSRIGQPNQIFGATEGLKSPMWAASIGALSPLFRSPLGGFVVPSHESHVSFIGGFASKLWHRIREPFVFRS